MAKGPLELAKTARITDFARRAQEAAGATQELLPFDSGPTEEIPIEPLQDPFIPEPEPVPLPDPGPPEGIYRPPEIPLSEPGGFPESLIEAPRVDPILTQQKAEEERQRALEEDRIIELASGASKEEEILGVDRLTFDVWKDKFSKMVSPIVSLGRFKRFEKRTLGPDIADTGEVPLWSTVSPLTSWDEFSLGAFFPERSFSFRGQVGRRKIQPGHFETGPVFTGVGGAGLAERAQEDALEAQQDMYAKNPRLRVLHMKEAREYRLAVYNHLKNHPEEPNDLIGYHPGDLSDFDQQEKKSEIRTEILTSLNQQLPWLEDQIRKIPGVGGEIEGHTLRGGDGWDGGEITRQRFEPETDVRQIAKRSFIGELEEPEFKSAKAIVTKQRELQTTIEGLEKDQSNLKKQIDEKSKGRFGVLKRPEFFRNADALSRFAEALGPEDEDLKTSLKSYASNSKEIDQLNKGFDPGELEEANIRAVAALEKRATAPVLNTTIWDSKKDKGIKPVDVAYYFLADEGHIPPAIYALRLMKLGYGDSPVFELEQEKLLDAYNRLSKATNPKAKRNAKIDILTTMTLSLSVAYSQRVRDGVAVDEASLEPTITPFKMDYGVSSDSQPFVHGKQVEHGTEEYSRFFNLQRSVAPIPMSMMRRRLSIYGDWRAWIHNGIILMPISDASFIKNQRKKSDVAKKVTSSYKHSPRALELMIDATRKNIIQPAQFAQLDGVNREYINRVRTQLQNKVVLPIMHEMGIEEVLRVARENQGPSVADIENNLINDRVYYTGQWPDEATDEILWRTEGLDPEQAAMMKYLTLEKIVEEIRTGEQDWGWTRLRNQVWNFGEQGWGIYHGLRGIYNGTKWFTGENLEHGLQLAQYNAEAMREFISDEGLSLETEKQVENEYQKLKDAYNQTGDVVRVAAGSYFDYLKGYSDPRTLGRRLSYDVTGTLLDFMAPIDFIQLGAKTAVGATKMSLWTYRANHLQRLRGIRIRARASGVPEVLIPGVEGKPTFLEIGGRKMRGPTAYDIDVPEGTQAIDIDKMPPLENIQMYPRQAGEEAEIIIKTSKQLENISQSKLNKIAEYPVWTNLLRRGTGWVTKSASKPGITNYIQSRVVSAEQHGGENVRFVVEQTRATPHVVRQQNARVANSVINEIAESGKYGTDSFERVLKFFRDFGEAISYLERMKGEGLPMSLSIVIEKVPRETIRRLSVTVKVPEGEATYWTVVDNLTGDEYGKFNGKASAEVAITDPNAMSKYGLPKGIDVEDDISIGSEHKYRIERSADWEEPSLSKMEAKWGMLSPERRKTTPRPERALERIKALEAQKKDLYGRVDDASLDSLGSINEELRELNEDYGIGEYKVVETKTGKEVSRWNTMDEAQDAYASEMFALGETEPVYYQLTGKDWAEAVGGEDAARKVAEAVAAHRAGDALRPDMIEVVVKDQFGNDVVLDAADLGIVRPMGTVWEFTPHAEQLFLKDGSSWTELAYKAYPTTHAYEKLKQISSLVEENLEDGLVIGNQIDLAEAHLRSVDDPARILDEAGQDIGLSAEVEPKEINYKKTYLLTERQARALAAKEDAATIEQSAYNNVYSGIVKSIHKRLRTKNLQRIADFYGELGNVNIKVEEDLGIQWALDNQATALVVPPKAEGDPYVIHVLPKNTQSVHDFNLKRHKKDAVAFIPDQNFHIAALRNAIEDVFTHKFSPESISTSLRGDKSGIFSDMASVPLPRPKVEAAADTESLLVKDGRFWYEKDANGKADKSIGAIHAVKINGQKRFVTWAPFSFDLPNDKVWYEWTPERGSLTGVADPDLGITADKKKDLIELLQKEPAPAKVSVAPDEKAVIIYPGGKFSKIHGMALRDAIETNEFFRAISTGELTPDQARRIINTSTTLRRVPARVPPAFSGSRFLWRKRYKANPTTTASSVEVSKHHMKEFIMSLEKHNEAFFLQPENQLLLVFIKGQKKQAKKRHISALEKPAYLMLPEEYANTYKKKLGDKAPGYRHVIKTALEEGIYNDAVKYNEELGGTVIDRETAIAIIQSAGLEVPDSLGLKVQKLRFDNAININAGFLADVEKKIVSKDGITFGAKGVRPDISLGKLAVKMDMETVNGVVFLDNVRVDGGTFKGRPEFIERFLSEMFPDSEIELRVKNLHSKQRNGANQYGKSVLNSESIDKHGVSVVMKDGKPLTNKEYQEAISAFIEKNDVSNVIVEALSDWRRTVEILDLRQDELAKLLLGDSLKITKDVVKKSLNMLTDEISEIAHGKAGILEPINLAKNAVGSLSGESLAGWTMYMKTGELPPIVDEKMLNAWHNAGLIQQPSPIGSGLPQTATELGVIAHLYRVSKKWEYYETLLHRAFMGRMKGGASPNLRMDWNKVIDSMPDFIEVTDPKTGKLVKKWDASLSASKHAMRDILNDWSYNATIDDIYLLMQEDILRHMNAGGFSSKNAVMNAFSYIKGIWESTLKENAQVAAGNTDAMRGTAMKESTAGLSQAEILLVNAAKGHGFNLGADVFTLFGFTRGEMVSRMGAIEIVEGLMKEGLARYGKDIAKTAEGIDEAVAPGGKGQYVKFDVKRMFGEQRLSPELSNRYKDLYVTRQAAEMLDAAGKSAKTWGELNEISLSLTTPMGYVLQDPSNLSQMIYRATRTFASKMEKDKTYINKLSFLSEKQASKLNEAFLKGHEVFYETWKKLDLNERTALPLFLKGLELTARTLNASDFMQRYKQYVLFWGPPTGVAKNIMGNGLMAMSNHPEAFLSPHYYEGIRLYFGVDKKNLGIMDLIGAFKNKVIEEGVGEAVKQVTAKGIKEGVVGTAEAIAGVAKTATGKRGLSKGEIFKFLGDPGVEGTAGWLADQLIARDVLAIGISGDWELSGPGSVLLGNQQKTLLLTESIRKIVVPQIEEGIKRIQAGKDTMSAELKAHVISEQMSLGFAAMRNDADFMAKLTDSFIQDITDKGITNISKEEAVRVLGHYLNKVDKIAMEYPQKLLGLEHWAEINRGMFVVTDDAYKFSYGYFLMKELGMGIDEIVQEIGRAYADYARNSPATHIITGFLPWAKYPIKAMVAIFMGRMKHPLYANLLTKIIGPMQRATDFQNDPDELIAHTMMSPHENGFIKRSDIGYLNAGWAFDLNPSRAHSNLVYNHPLYQAFVPISIMFNDEFMDAYGQQNTPLYAGINTKESWYNKVDYYGSKIATIQAVRMDMMGQRMGIKSGELAMKMFRGQFGPDENAEGAPKTDWGKAMFIPGGKTLEQAQAMLYGLDLRAGTYKDQVPRKITFKDFKNLSLFGMNFGAPLIERFIKNQRSAAAPFEQAKRLSRNLGLVAPDVSEYQGLERRTQATMDLLEKQGPGFVESLGLAGSSLLGGAISEPAKALGPQGQIFKMLPQMEGIKQKYSPTSDLDSQLMRIQSIIETTRPTGMSLEGTAIPGMQQFIPKPTED